jgi:hypothetical protein
VVQFVHRFNPVAARVGDTAAVLAAHREWRLPIESVIW